MHYHRSLPTSAGSSSLPTCSAVTSAHSIGWKLFAMPPGRVRRQTVLGDPSWTSTEIVRTGELADSRVAAFSARKEERDRIQGVQTMGLRPWI
jgi:hypothetical protein